MRRKHFSMTAARCLLRAGAAAAVAAGLALLGLPGGTALAATAVSNATLQVSSLSAAATDVSYTVNFATPSALTSGTSKITLLPRPAPPSRRRAARATASTTTSAAPPDAAPSR